LLCVILNHTAELEAKGVAAIKIALEKLEKNLPSDYSIAAKEAVNNKRERSVRNKILCKEILGIDEG
jgi:hypothetical protein